MKKKVAVIGQFSPPIHGLSKALDTLCNSQIKDEFDLDKIDIKDNKKFFISIIKILKSKNDLYYLTISQSKFGNIRDLIIMKIIQIKKKKLIIHLHGGGFRELLDNEWGSLQRKINISILKNVDGAIVLGKALRKIFFGIVPKEKIFVVENCVDDKFIINNSEFFKKVELLNERKKYKIMYLSNFIKDKGYLEVLEIAKECINIQEHRIEFVFAGRFFDEVEKKKFMEQIKNMENVKYLGTVYGEDKLNELRKNEAFILLTKYKNEGQPISIIEAMANGLYVITTNHAGIQDLVSKENAKIINLKEFDAIKIAKSLSEDINKMDEIKNMIIHNRKKVEERFLEKNYINNIRKIFEEYTCESGEDYANI